MIEAAPLERAWIDSLQIDGALISKGGVTQALCADHIGVLQKTGCPSLVYGPAPVFDELAHLFGAVAPDLPDALELIVQSFGDRVDRVLGPAWYSHATGKTLRPVPRINARSFQEDDAEAIADLKRVTPPEQWLEADMHSPVNYVYELDGQILGLANVGEWRGMSTFGVLTHPEARGRGIAKELVSLAAAEALAGVELLQYRAWAANAASIAVARAIGFHEYGHHVVVDIHGQT